MASACQALCESLDKAEKESTLARKEARALSREKADRVMIMQQANDRAVKLILEESGYAVRKANLICKQEEYELRKLEDAWLLVLRESGRKEALKYDML